MAILAQLQIKEEGQTDAMCGIMLARPMQPLAPRSRALPATIRTLSPSVRSPGLQLYREQATESGAVYLFFTPRGGWVKLLGYDFSGACSTALR